MSVEAWEAELHQLPRMKKRAELEAANGRADARPIGGRHPGRAHDSEGKGMGEAPEMGGAREKRGSSGGKMEGGSRGKPGLGHGPGQRGKEEWSRLLGSCPGGDRFVPIFFSSYNSRGSLSMNNFMGATRLPNDPLIL